MRESKGINGLGALFLIGPILMIPAGLAGIAAGVQGLAHAEFQLSGLLVAIQGALEALLPWCMPVGCLLFGLTMTALAALLLARGLQSTQS